MCFNIYWYENVSENAYPLETKNIHFNYLTFNLCCLFMYIIKKSFVSFIKLSCWLSLKEFEHIIMIICFIVIFKLWINTKAIRNWQPFLVLVFCAIFGNKFWRQNWIKRRSNRFLDRNGDHISKHSQGNVYLKTFSIIWWPMIKYCLVHFFPPFSSLLFFKGFFLLFSRLSLLYVYYKYFSAIFDIFIFLRPKCII